MSLVPDQCLFDSAVPFDHIYQIVNDTVLQSHDHVKVTQTDIRIDQADFAARFCKTCSNVCGCSGLTYTAFS